MNPRNRPVLAAVAAWWATLWVTAALYIAVPMAALVVVGDDEDPSLRAVESWSCFGLASSPFIGFIVAAGVYYWCSGGSVGCCADGNESCGSSGETRHERGAERPG